MSPSKNILVTGASTGIGYAVAQSFLQRGYRVYGSVRKEEDADRLSKAFGTDFHPLLFDVTDHAAVDAAAAQLSAQLHEEGLSGLINNAGIAVAGPFIDLEVDDFRRQFEVNVFGMIKVTQAFLPLLGARPQHVGAPGRIIQISSISGRLGMPFVSAYAGSKYAMEGITESLRRELMGYGIDLVLIEPGPIKTPIWEKSMDPVAENFKDSVYHPIMKKSQEKLMKPSIQRALTASRAAALILKEFEKKRPAARRVIVAQKFFSWTLPRLLPARWLDTVLAKVLGLTPKKFMH